MKKISVLFAALVIGAVALFSASCMKEPELNKDFGPEVSKDEIVNAINSAPTVSPGTLKLSEFSYTESVTRIENLAPTLTLQLSETITRKMSCDTKRDPNGVILPKPAECNQYMKGYEGFWMAIVTETRELQDGQMKPSKTERGLGVVSGISPTSDPMSVESFSLESAINAASEIKSASMLSKEALIQALSRVDPKNARTRSGQGQVSFHNLNVIPSQFPVPNLVRMRPGCGGLTDPSCTTGSCPCKSAVSSTLVTYDVIDWTGEQPVRSSYMYVIGKDSPWLSRQLMFCGSTTVPYNGARVALMRCDEIKDFTFGQDPP